MLCPKRGKLTGFRDKSSEGIVGLKDMLIGILTDMGNEHGPIGEVPTESDTTFGVGILGLLGLFGCHM